MDEITAPKGWNSIGTEFEQQEYAFQRSRDGLVISIERGVTQDKYSVSFLPENFHEDNQVIRSYGDSGYLYSGDSLEDALERTKEWMKNNKR